MFNRKFCYIQIKILLSCENSEILILERATVHKSACSKDSVGWMKWDDIDTTDLMEHEVDREEVLQRRRPVRIGYNLHVTEYI